MHEAIKRTVFVIGLPGSGKTWLLHALCRALSKDLTRNVQLLHDGMWKPVTSDAFGIPSSRLSGEMAAKFRIRTYFEISWREISIDRGAYERLRSVLQSTDELIDLVIVVELPPSIRKLEKADTNQNNPPQMDDLWSVFEQLVLNSTSIFRRCAIVLSKLDQRHDWVLHPARFLREIIEQGQPGTRAEKITDLEIPIIKLSSCGYRYDIASDRWLPNLVDLNQDSAQGREDVAIRTIDNTKDGWHPDNLKPLIDFLFRDPEIGIKKPRSRILQRPLPKSKPSAPRTGDTVQGSEYEIEADIALVGMTSSGKTRLRASLQKSAIEDMLLPVPSPGLRPMSDSDSVAFVYFRDAPNRWRTQPLTGEDFDRLPPTTSTITDQLIMRPRDPDNRALPPVLFNIFDEQGASFNAWSNHIVHRLQSAAALILCIDSSLSDSWRLAPTPERGQQLQSDAIKSYAQVIEFVDRLCVALVPKPKIAINRPSQERCSLPKQNVAICFTKYDLMFTQRQLAFSDPQVERLLAFAHEGWDIANPNEWPQSALDPLTVHNAPQEIIDATTRLKQSIINLAPTFSAHGYLVSAFGRLNDGWNLRVEDNKLADPGQWSPWHTFSPIRWTLETILEWFVQQREISG